MTIVVGGVVDVRLAPGTVLHAGDRLTASALPGLARALQTRTIDGMVVSEGAPTIGVALADTAPGATTVPVFVTLR